VPIKSLFNKYRCKSNAKLEKTRISSIVVVSGISVLGELFGHLVGKLSFTAPPVILLHDCAAGDGSAVKDGDLDGAGVDQILEVLPAVEQALDLERAFSPQWADRGLVGADLIASAVVVVDDLEEDAVDGRHIIPVRADLDVAELLVEVL